MNPTEISCFDFVTSSGQRQLTFEDAAHLIQSVALSDQPIERIALTQLMGRILAENIIAPFDVPPHRNAAMDGFALKGEELLSRNTWQLIGQSFAGKGFQGNIGTGDTVQMTTGAPMPMGLDTVVMKEMCRVENNQLYIERAQAVKVSSNVRLAGEDIQANSVVLNHGQRLGAVEIGLLASLGFAEVGVYRPLRVAVFSTGDEVCAPGDVRSHDGIYDTNRFSLISMLKALGCDVSDLGILPDDQAIIEYALREAAQQHQLVITSGGVSVGEADFVKQALNTLGKTNFWQLAIRPGRPLAFGDLGLNAEHKTCLFAGLPGNPVAAMVTFCLLIQPLIRTLQGESQWRGVSWIVKATEPMKSRLGRSDFHRGVFSVTEKGQVEVQTTGKQGSGILTSMHEANCLIRIEEHLDHIEVGDCVRIYPFSCWLPGFPLA